MRVLVTGVGGDVGQGVVAVLRRRYPDWIVNGCDSRSRHAGAHIVDHFAVAPPVDGTAYLDWIVNSCRSLRIDALLPCSDVEIRALANAASDLPATLVAPNQLAIDVGQDKLATANFLAERGIPGPRTVRASDAGQMSYPCILKPRRGQGSRGVHLCASEQEARALADLVPDPILQEILKPADEEVTCGVYRTGGGSIAVVALRRVLAGGATAWAEVIDDQQVIDYCSEIATSLDLRGSINLQMIRTELGPRLFEINPRFSSTVAMRDALGFTDVVWALQEGLLGQTPVLATPAAGSVVYRVVSVGIAQTSS